MAWTRGPTIGRGSTATVSIATTSAGDLFAVKSTDLNSSALLQKEESLLSHLSSPHIIRCFGSDVTSDQDKSVFNLFLEYSGGGSLSDLIRKQGGALEEESIRFYSRQLLLGLEYLHRNGIVHCDIKGQNILIGVDALKIADFGCAKRAESGSAFSGTPAYMAPEVCRGEEQSFAADVWAMGCTVVEMATGRHPWPEMKDPAAAVYRIAHSGEVPELPSWLSGDARDFAGKCLVREPERRWTAAELLRHPFLEGCGGVVGEVARRSPTSVTDQGFWDSVEELESLEIVTEVVPSLPSESPSRRIGALIGDDALGWSDFEEDRDWVTVRGNIGIEECEDLNKNLEEERILASTINLELMEDSCYNFFIGDCNCISPIAHNQSVEKIMYSELSFFEDHVIIQHFQSLNYCQCSSNDSFGLLLCWLLFGQMIIIFWHYKHLKVSIVNITKLKNDLLYLAIDNRNNTDIGFLH